MISSPGRPRLLRELNNRAALELLGSKGPLTRARISESTGLSKVATGQILSRLEERGLVVKTGTQDGGRGPSAVVYGLNPSSAYVVGVEVGMGTTTAVLADVTGRRLAKVSRATDAEVEPVAAIRSVLKDLTRASRVGLSRVSACVIGISAVVDPRTGDVRFCYDMPAWRAGVAGALRHDLGIPVALDNDVNLAAVAERVRGAARDTRSFALVWIGRGPGSAIMLGDRLLRGAAGNAGEIGWMPVPGAPVAGGALDHDRCGVNAAFQSLVGRHAVLALAAAHGIAEGSVRDVVAAAAGSAEGGAFLDELAGRIALGVASICAVLDPELVVLGGDAGTAGGRDLARRVQRAVSAMYLAEPCVVASEVPRDPVLQGAVHMAMRQARELVFSRGSD
ncbi:ROK family transcriptional regulator [Sphaerisporangium sp. NPDC051017]|uniref:ROK family transcriptional regulator n=1 Tax=Sphaerisporangium sp. NPDC051017 TaxID=3154636 RepID=UPI00343A5E25